MRVLLCGGAGYIGSHMLKWLASRGYDVTVFDNLSSGHVEALRWGDFVQGDLLNAEEVNYVFESSSFDAVLHFSALSIVRDSVSQPYEYYSNNVVGTLNLLRAMRRHHVNRIVFSSSAAVFGAPVDEQIDENHPKEPINPYGASKLMVERLLSDAANAYGLRSVALRYFNAAGASPDGDIGESHHPETHLIPNALRAVLPGESELEVFGDDYATPDGTCIRDYIHVDDLAQAHEQALLYMLSNEGAQDFNLGSGRGYSIREVLKSIERVTGVEVPHRIAPRRIGDPERLVASKRRAERVLGWKPKFNSLDEIIATAWRWQLAPAY